MIKATAAGDTGLLIDTDLPPASLAAAISRAGLPGIAEIIPGARTVLVITEPDGGPSLDWLTARIAALSPDEAASAAEPAIEIPVSYDGPDLAEVASLTGMPVADVIEAHADGLYTVGWLGFAPGFGYLTGLDQRLSGIGRLETPRLAVPAGSVAIAAGLTAVYPSVSPGGWRLLGRTPARMWDPDREPAALLAPGRQVRFRPMSAGEAIETASPTTHPARQDSPAGPARSLEVIRPGPLATVQDLGRRGLGASGVPPSGAADQVSLGVANRLAGNQAGAAGIELTLGRASFRCCGDLTLAVAGAPAEVTVTAGPDRAARPVAFGTSFSVPDGGVVSIGAPRAGLRSYLAVSGGLAVPAQLGSRSADLLSGLGGGPLRAGMILPVGADEADLAGLEDTAGESTVRERGAVVRLRVIGGPRLGWFEAGALERLCGSLYSVTPASNRTGLRLAGPPLRRATDGELPSEGMVTGSLEVPPDGLPILLLADHPTTGGYPVIAVVASTDLGLAAQLRPGDQISFAG